MSERFGHDPSLRLPLQAVVTNRRGGAQPFFRIPGIEQALPGRIVAPDAGIAVRLQFLPDRELIGLPLAHA